MSAALLLALLAAAPDGGYPFYAKDPIQLDTSRYALNGGWVDGGYIATPYRGSHWSEATWLQSHGWTSCPEPVVYWRYDVGGVTYWSYELPNTKNSTRVIMCRDDVPPPPPCPVPGSIGCGLRYSAETALPHQDAGH